MFLLLTFIASIVGPFFGLWAGMIPCANKIRDRGIACLYAGVFSSTLGAVAGIVISAIVLACTSGGCTQEVLEVLGGVNGIVWCGWVSLVFACLVGIYTAGVNSDDSDSKAASR